MRSFRSLGRESIADLKIARCLLELLDRHGADWERVFREFEKARKVNTDAIADMAVENFVEMRDRVADPRFLFRKKVELALEARYPQLFVPKYAMVTFHRIPYATALKRGQVQDRMLTELCDGIERVEDLDWSKADALIRTGADTTGAGFVTGATFQPGEEFARRNGCPRSSGPFSRAFLHSKNEERATTAFICAGTRSGCNRKRAGSYLEQELQDWAELGVEGHFHAKNPWMPYHRLLTQQTAELVGAEPGGSCRDEFADGESALDDGVVLSSDDAETQDSGRARSFSFGSVCGEVADSLSWV